MADEQPASGLEIDGEVYEVPLPDSFDMDEAQILYDLSGLSLHDFMPAHPDLPELQREALLQIQVTKVRDPAFQRALVHVAYRRRHQDKYDFKEFDKAIGKLPAIDVMGAVFKRGDVEDPSQSSPKLSDEKSSTNGTSEPSSSGKLSGSDSETPAETLAPTGIGESVMSSPVLAQAILASGS